ncbi:hypothetical protein SGPA1_21138 [Streptomyces misionensis JCM 4497]
MADAGAGADLGDAGRRSPGHHGLRHARRGPDEERGPRPGAGRRRSGRPRGRAARQSAGRADGDQLRGRPGPARGRADRRGPQEARRRLRGGVPGLRPLPAHPAADVLRPPQGHLLHPRPGEGRGHGADAARGHPRRPGDAVPVDGGDRPAPRPVGRGARQQGRRPHRVRLLGVRAPQGRRLPALRLPARERQLLPGGREGVERHPGPHRLNRTDRTHRPMTEAAAARWP